MIVLKKKLKFVVFLAFIALFLGLMFFDIIDWLIPGDFPDWVYVAELIVFGALGVMEIVTFFKDK